MVAMTIHEVGQRLGLLLRVHTDKAGLIRTGMEGHVADILHKATLEEKSVVMIRGRCRNDEEPIPASWGK